MRKGISLPVETVIVIVLAIIVLAALLLFFTGTFTPGSDKIKLEQRKVDLCSNYVAADSECRLPPPDTKLKTDLEKVCGDLGLPTNAAACCSTYCGSVKCEDQGDKYGCVKLDDCRNVHKGSPTKGICSNSNHICCKSP